LLTEYATHISKSCIQRKTITLREE